MSLGDWIQAQLFERRIVLVTGRLDDEVAAKAAAALVALDAAADRPIELHVQSADGALEAAFVLIDTDLLWKLYAHLARRTGRPAEEIAEDLRRGRYLDARDALAYGLVDDIATAT